MTGIRFSISLNNRLAVVLPTYSIDDLIKLASVAEELGFKTIWVHDSLLDSPRFEPIALLGALAVSTKSIKLGTSILQPHFRNPVVLALSWATLDVLSKGRTILGVGIGGGTAKGIEQECRVVGIKKEKRGLILEDIVQLLRKLWLENSVSYHSQFFDISDISLGVKPIQKPPPIWIAAGIYIPEDKEVSATPGYTSSKGIYKGQFDRVARLADGWFTLMATPEEFQRAWQYIREKARQVGRDPDSIIPCQEFWININEDKQESWKETTALIELYFNSKVSNQTLTRWSISGTRRDCITKIEQYVEAGVKEFKFFLASKDQIKMLRKIHDDIVKSFY
jgi:alkanesulfonate monooxygenase